MLEHPFLLKVLGIEETDAELTPYDLLGLSPDTYSDELLEYELRERRKKLRQNVPNPQFIPIIAAFEKQLEEAAATLRDPARRQALDAEVAQAQQARRHDDRVAELRKKVRALLDRVTDAEGCLADEKRPAVKKKLEELGIAGVDRLLERIPRPAAAQKTGQKELAKHFAASVDLAVSNGFLAPEEEEQLLGMANNLGLNDANARKVIELRLEANGARRGRPDDTVLKKRYERFEKRVAQQCPDGKSTLRDWKRLQALASIDGVPPGEAQAIMERLLEPPSTRGGPPPGTRSVRRRSGGGSRRGGRGARGGRGGRKKGDGAGLALGIAAVLLAVVGGIVWMKMQSPARVDDPAAASGEDAPDAGRTPAPDDGDGDEKPPPDEGSSAPKGEDGEDGDDAAPDHASDDDSAADDEATGESDPGETPDGDADGASSAAAGGADAGAAPEGDADDAPPAGPLAEATLAPGLRKSFASDRNETGVLADGAALLYLVAAQANHFAARRSPPEDTLAPLGKADDRVAVLTNNFRFRTATAAVGNPADRADRAKAVTDALLGRARPGERARLIAKTARESPAVAAEAFTDAVVQLAEEDHPSDRDEELMNRLLRALVTLPSPKPPRRLSPLVSKASDPWFAFLVSRALLDGMERNAWSGILSGYRSNNPALRLKPASTERERSRVAVEWKLIFDSKQEDATSAADGADDAAPPMPLDRLRLVGSVARLARAAADELKAFDWSKPIDRPAVLPAPSSKTTLDAAAVDELDDALEAYLDQIDRLLGKAPALRDDEDKAAASLRLQAEMASLERPGRLALCETPLQRAAVRLDCGVRLLETLLRAVRPDASAKSRIDALRAERAEALGNPPHVFAEIRTNAYYNALLWEHIVREGAAP